ncbi:MAG: hypothetical protein ABFS23_06040 [Pseudomonadota bacterium]
MAFLLIGLVLATLFGVFYGSEGILDPKTFNLIFWSLIIGGAVLNLFVILRDTLCSHCHCNFCHTGAR